MAHFSTRTRRVPVNLPVNLHGIKDPALGVICIQSGPQG
jgi:hypothetical protein